jgi:hypothetical protein
MATPELKHPLGDAELAIESLHRRSLRRLVDRSVLWVVNNTYLHETYSPRVIAFHYC